MNAFNRENASHSSNRTRIWTIAGLAVVLGLAAATLGILFNFKQAEYRALGQGTGSGAEVVARGREGDRLGVATNVLVISTGVGLVTSALLATFTNFDQAK